MHTTVKGPFLGNADRKEVTCAASSSRLEANTDDIARLDELRKQVAETSRNAVKIES
ncbi:MAG: hypothetical protein WC843_02675 [Candidatus Gracilibacteria bacterium]|jgi:hypothetical protein